MAYPPYPAPACGKHVGLPTNLALGLKTLFIIKTLMQAQAQRMASTTVEKSTEPSLIQLVVHLLPGLAVADPLLILR